MTIDITSTLMSMVGGVPAADERPIALIAGGEPACFAVDLCVDQLGATPECFKVSVPDVPLIDPEPQDPSEDPPAAEPMYWPGMNLLLSIDQHLSGRVVGSEASSLPQELIAASPETLSNQPQQTDVSATLLGESGTPDTSESRPASIEPIEIDVQPHDPPSVDTAVHLAPIATDPSNHSPSSTIDGKLFSDMSPEEETVSLIDQTPRQSTDEGNSTTFDGSTSEAEITATADRLAGMPAHQTHVSTPSSPPPQSFTESVHRPASRPAELRTEMSEVIRHVRTMVTAHETRSTIQLAPAELGRMTLEVVQAPEGVRAHISAEDPAVQKFLEHNVRLLETEARIQGAGQMSFSVRADVAGGFGRGDQRHSEAEATFRKTTEWNTLPPAKPRSRRELDTNA